MPGFDNELEKIVTELNRAVPGGSALSSRPSAGLEQLLATAAERHASDLLLVADSPAMIRFSGNLVPAQSDPLNSDDVQSLLFPLINPDQRAELQRRKSLDFSFVRTNGIRCRANLHFQRGTVAACIRLLPAKIPTLEALHLPVSLGKLIERRQGLILVTGPTGCGKTTTLAALIELVNRKSKYHIVTIEDPIEYQYANAQSVVEQIEVGRDTPDFVNSLRSIVRQNPDVILVGEMRDAETMTTVLTAAETGHLVFSTLHTNDTGQAISRILDSFPQANQAQIRQQLSLALTAIIAQQLVPGAEGTKRFPAAEIMIATDAVRSLIRRGDDHHLRLQISTGRAHGMMTMEQSLAEMVRQGTITRDTAMAHCFRPEDLRLHLE